MNVLRLFMGYQIYIRGMSAEGRKQIVVSQALSKIDVDEYEKFNIFGISNGIVIETDERQKKAVLYIKPTIHNNCLIYQAILIKPFTKSSKQLLQKIQLSNQNTFNPIEMLSWKDISKLQITMKQANNNPNIVAVMISTFRNGQQSKKDSMFILRVIKEDQSHQQRQMGKDRFVFEKVQCGGRNICDFQWQNKCQHTLEILLSSEVLQIWEIVAQKQLIKTGQIYIRKIMQLSESNIAKIIGFCSQQLSQQQLEQKELNLSPNKFSLFLLSQKGQICRLFPYIPNGLQIKELEYTYYINYHIHKNAKISVRDDQLENIQTCLLYNSKIIAKKNIKVVSQINQYQKNIEKIYVQTNYQKNCQSNSESVIRKQSQKDIVFSKYFKIIKINQKLSLLIITQYNTKLKNAIIFFKILEQKENNMEITSIYQLSFNNVHSKCEIYQSNYLSQTQKYVYFFVDNNFVKINYQQPIQSLLSKTTQSIISKQRKLNFHPLLVFKLNNKQTINSMIPNLRQNYIILIRTLGNKVKYSIQYIKPNSILKEIAEISQFSEQIFKNIEQKRFHKELNSKNMRNKYTEEFKNIYGLKFREQQIKKYGKQGIKLLENNYERYFMEIKNYIDQNLNKLKVKYQNLESKLKVFREQRKKKEKIDRLLLKIEENNSIIESQGYQNQSQLKNQRKTTTKSNILQQKINLLTKLSSKVSQHEQDFFQLSEIQMNQDANNQLQKLLNIKSQLLNLQIQNKASKLTF